MSLLIGFLAAALIALFAYRSRSLTLSGAIATTLLGTVVFGLGGIAASVPLITFFVLSSALSRIGKGDRRRRAEEAFEKGGRRDAAQVLANGGVAGVIVVLNAIAPSPALVVAYLGSLAAAAADTWGTEIGILGRGAVISVATLRRVEPGRSGGISAIGTLGALVGAALVAASGAYWSENVITTIAIATVAGMAGMLADSLAGATIQARYRCTRCGRLTERRVHCDHPTVLASGVRIVGNDIVNVICVAVGAAVAWGMSR
jgi:uncharacterized protein (TIGR00297 family)